MILHLMSVDISYLSFPAMRFHFTCLSYDLSFLCLQTALDCSQFQLYIRHVAFLNCRCTLHLAFVIYHDSFHIAYLSFIVFRISCVCSHFTLRSYHFTIHTCHVSFRIALCCLDTYCVLMANLLGTCEILC